MSSHAFSQAVTRALASSASFNHGALIKPNVRAVPEFEVRGSIPPPLTQWVLQGDKFDTALVDQYNMIKPGETRMLIAATGIGKTTKLPLKLALLSGKAGLVLLPDNDITSRVVKYVSSSVSSNNNVFVSVLRSENIKNPPMGPAVYYCAATDFLSRFHADRSIVDRLNIDFIYLDEAHTINPAYYIMRLFVGMNFFPSTKVFYGTATQAGTSLLLTGTSHKTKPIPCPPLHFPLDSPEDTPSESPLFASNISARTLVFLPTDHHIDLWEQYYDSFDVRVFTFKSYDSAKKLDVLETVTRIKAPLAILTNHRLEFGHTFHWDVSIDSSRKQVMDVDYSLPAINLVLRNTTASERTQRAGRVQRHLAGAAYYCDLPLHPPLPDLDLSTSLYAWMWLRLYRVSIKNPEISQFEELLGEFSDEAISLLLCSRLHPLLVIPYLREDGSLFSGWHVMKHVFHTTSEATLSQERNDEFVDMWPTFNTGPQLWLAEPMQYKCRAAFPSEWQALPAAAWRTYITGEKPYGINFDNNSVISALVPDKKMQPKRVASAAKSTVNKGYVGRPMSVMTSKKTESPLGDKFDFPTILEEETPQVAVASSSRQVATFAPKHVRQLSSVPTEEIPRDEAAIEKWVQEVPVGKKKRRSSHKSSSSGSSHDKSFVELKKVNPRDYKFYKLYPLDTNALSLYLSDESAHETDFERFRSLTSLHRNFASLRRDQQERVEAQTAYFLSVLRVHNNQVMAKLQLKSSGVESYSFIQKFMGRDMSTVDVNVEASTRLLQSMQFEGFFVGIDKRTLHTSTNTGYSYSSKIDKLKLLGRYVLSTAALQLDQTIHEFEDSCVPIKHADAVVGTSWHIGKALLVLKHTYEQVDLPTKHVVVVDSEQHDMIVARVDTSAVCHPKLRGPVENEEVLAVGHDPITLEYTILGPFTVSVIGDVWCMSDSLMTNYSGFGLISTSDYAMVGMYRGFYMSNEAGQDFGHFASMNTFVSKIAIVYN